MAGEEAAATIYRWLDQMLGPSPQVLEIFEAFYRKDSEAAVNAVSTALGLEIPKPESNVTGNTLLEWFKEASGDHTTADSGQIAIDSAWTDPTAPAAGQKFKLVWEEQNIGNGPTGKYKTAIEVNDQIYKELEYESLDAGAKVQREAEVEAQNEGERSFYIYSPWSGERTSTLQTQAGVQNGFVARVPIGEDAAARVEKQQREDEIHGAMSTAIGYLSQLSMTPDFDTSHIQYALQAVANVAPSLDSTLDLMGKAAQMMARDPKTVGPEPREEAKTKAKDAIVALTAAQTRTLIDEASPVDHPDVVSAATLTAAVADVIIAAPVVEVNA